MDRLVEEVIARLSELKPTYSLDDGLNALAESLIVALIVFVGFLIAWFFLRRLLRASLAKARLDIAAASLIETLAQYVFLSVGVIYALLAAGFDVSALLLALGIIGLTLGLAARDAVSNLASGLLIHTYRPFVVGDLIEVDGDCGRVHAITLRATRIVTADGRMLAVPNSVIVNKTVASYTRFPHLRLDIQLTIGVTENLDRVRRLLLDVVEADDDYMTDPPPQVVVTALNDYNIAIELQAWLRDERDHIPKRHELRERAFVALVEAGVDMPFETIQLAPMDVRTRSNGN
jgi:small conductance mechanosensitive channel